MRKYVLVIYCVVSFYFFSVVYAAGEPHKVFGTHRSPFAGVIRHNVVEVIFDTPPPSLCRRYAKRPKQYQVSIVTL